MEKRRKIFMNISLGIGFLLILILAPLKINSVHQFCPYSAICFGPMVLRGFPAYIATAILGILIAISTIFFGRKFCGYICFLGTLQEYFFNLNKRKRIIIPQKLEKLLSSIKYIIFVITLFFAIFLIQYKYMKFCPIQILAFFIPLGFALFTTLIILFVFGFFIERFWCRFVCPYAAFMNILQIVGRRFRLKKFMLKRNWEVCIDCNNCAKNCPMKIQIMNFEEITDKNCIFCLKCVGACPIKNGLK